jgi:hypothetical protein
MNKKTRGLLTLALGFLVGFVLMYLVTHGLPR